MDDSKRTEKNQIGELYQTVQKMRKEGRGGKIPRQDIESIGQLLDTVKEAKKKLK